MFKRRLPGYLSRIEAPMLILSLGVLLICLVYAFVFVEKVAYMGVHFTPTAEGWQINTIEPCDERPEWCANRDRLAVGDILLRIGDLEFETYSTTSSTPLVGYSPGDSVLLKVRRGDTEFETLWELPRVRLVERLIRVTGIALFFPFWLAGTVVLILLRPRDQGWRLLVAFNYVTALWLAIGSVSTWQVWYASILLHIIAWFILPVYLHLHLAVPTSLIRPGVRRFLIGLYGLAVLMSILEITRLIYRQLFFLAFVLAVAGSIGILIFRLSRKAFVREKPATRLMLFGIVMGIGPTVLLSVGLVFTPLIPASLTLNLSLFFVPALPLAYTYALYKQQLGPMEFRANRLLGVYSFSLLLLLLFFVLFAIGIPAVDNVSPSAAYLYTIISVLAFVVFTVAIRARFERWINQLAYGVRYEPEQLVSLFARKLSGISQREKLLQIIDNDILPNMLIRQSMLWLKHPGDDYELLFATGMDQKTAPLTSERAGLLRANSGNYLPQPIIGLSQYDWVRMVVPLEIRQRSLGIWLFGRRDPDDFYPWSDVQLLQTLAGLIAPVLENIHLFDLVQHNLDDQAALLAASQAVNSNKDWPTALSDVADVLVETLGVTRVTISEWDSQEETRSILAVSLNPAVKIVEAMKTNLPPTCIHEPAWPARMPPAGAYALEHVDDPDIAEHRKRTLAKRGATQLLTFPIYAREHLVGSVYLWDQRQDHEFQPEEISLTQAIVQQVALAFENAQLFRAEEQRRQEAELLAKLSEYLAATLEVDEVLSRVVESVRRYIDDMHNSSISILEPNGLFLRPHVSWSSKPEYEIVASKDPIPLSEAQISRQVIETLQPICIEDLILEENGHVGRHHLLRNPRSLLYVPLIVRGEAIGILHVHVFDDPYRFRPEEISFCVNVANQAATAIENARLFAAERRQLRLARTLQEMGVLLTTQLQLDEIFERIFELLAHVVAYDSVSIQLFDKEGNHYLAAGRGFRDFEKISRVSQGIYPQSTHIAVNEQGLVISDTMTDDRWHVVPGAEYIRSWVGMPLQVKGVVIGMLNVDSASPYAYDETSVETIRAFANQAAVALENARLYRETHERVNELAVLHQVALATAALLEVDDLFRQTTEMIVSSLNYKPFGFLMVQDDHLRPHASFHGLPAGAFKHAIPFQKQEGFLTNIAPQILAGEKSMTILRPLWPEVKKAVCVPVQVRSKVVSWLCAFSSNEDVFSDNDLRFLATLAGQVAGAIERAQLYDALQIHAADLAAEVNTRTAQLLTERDRMQAILHNAGEGIFFTSPAGILLFANPAAIRLTGFRTEEVIGQHMVDWWGDLITQETRQELLRTIEEGESWRGEVTGMRKTGVGYAVRLTLAPIHDADDSVTGYVGVQSDITRLREVDRLRTEFIANVSHELRTPLTNIKTYLALLERGKPQSRQRHINVIKMESERLRRLIEDLLDFSRRNPGQLQSKPVGLLKLVNQTLNAFAAKAQEKNITLCTDFNAGVPVVMGDAHQLGQVLANLVNNALAYTPPGGRVTISTAMSRQNGTQAAFIRVADTGLGIAKNDMPFIFERFYRGSASRQGNTPGTGLGLAISQDIVQRHGGHMHVESEQNQGSIFTVWLPVNGDGENTN